MTPVIHTALCSFGMSGKVFHAPFITAQPGLDLYGVWERSRHLAREQYPSVKVFATLEEMLSDENVSLVVVNTPNYTHYEYAKKSLQAGKHVLVEKPFAVTVREAEELIGLAAAQQKILSVFQNRRYDSDFQLVQKVVCEKSLGEILEAELHYDRYNQVLSPKQHKENPGPGTGILYDLGSHLIDQALQLFGMPMAVFSDLRNTRPASKVEDYMDLLLYYPALRVRLKSGYFVREPLPAYVLHGVLGSFHKSRADVQEAALLAGGTPGTPGWGMEPETEKGFLHTEKDGKEVREYLAAPSGNYGAFYAALYETLAQGQPAPVTGADGLAIIRVIEAAYKSYAGRCVVDL